MSGIWNNCIVNRYILGSVMSVSGRARVESFVRKKLRAHRIFCVTTAMTSSCTAALSRNVRNMAEKRETRYELIVEA